MPQLAAPFTSLPPEYQAVIRLAREQHGISITPRQELVGGWVKAAVYLVKEFYDTLGIRLNPGQYATQPVSILTPPLKSLIEQYPAMPPEKRAKRVKIDGHLLDGNIAAVLTDVPVPKYQSKQARVK